LNALEMSVAFKQGLDKFDSLNYPDFETDQIELLLNQAQDLFIKQRYGSTNVKRESFEQTQKRTEDLKAVVVNQVIVPAANAVDNISPYSRFVTLPTDHWFIIQELTDISYTNCNSQVVTDRVFTEAIQHNDYSKIINNPFAQPNENKVLRLMENGRVELIPASNVTISNYRLRYIKKPVRISITNSVDCELSEHTHQEIVNLSIDIALEGIESKRLQTFEQSVLNKQE